MDFTQMLKKIKQTFTQNKRLPKKDSTQDFFNERASAANSSSRFIKHQHSKSAFVNSSNNDPITFIAPPKFLVRNFSLRKPKREYRASLESPNNSIESSSSRLSNQINRGEDYVSYNSNILEPKLNRKFSFKRTFNPKNKRKPSFNKHKSDVILPGEASSITSQALCEEPLPINAFRQLPNFHCKSTSSTDYTFLVEESSLNCPSRPESWQSEPSHNTTLKKCPYAFNPSSSLQFSTPKLHRQLLPPSQHIPISSETLINNTMSSMNLVSAKTYPLLDKNMNSIDSSPNTMLLQDLTKLLPKLEPAQFPPLRNIDSFSSDEHHVIVHPPLTEPQFFSCEVKLWET